jgi:hypothetical protein
MVVELLKSLMSEFQLIQALFDRLAFFNDLLYRP